MISPQPSAIISISYSFYISRKAALLNYPKAYVKCGDFIYSGRGVGRRDKSEAFKCYQKAALMNDSEAMNSLGLMIETGFDDRLGDPDAALEYYKKALKLGNSDASINIAMLYLNVCFHLYLCRV